MVAFVASTGAATMNVFTLLVHRSLGGAPVYRWAQVFEQMRRLPTGPFYATDKRVRNGGQLVVEMTSFMPHGGHESAYIPWWAVRVMLATGMVTQAEPDGAMTAIPIDWFGTMKYRFGVTWMQRAGRWMVDGGKNTITDHCLSVFRDVGLLTARLHGGPPHRPHFEFTKNAPTAVVVPAVDFELKDLQMHG